MRINPAAAVQAYWSIGAAVTDIDAGHISWHPTAPAIDLGNFLVLRHCPDPQTLTGALAAYDDIVGERCTKIIRTEDGDPVTAAQLSMADWAPELLINLVFDDADDFRGPVAGGGTRLDPVHTDDDWCAVRRLFRIDHQEEDDRAGRPRRPEQLTDQSIELRRCISRQATYFLARSQGRTIGTIAVWIRTDGVGVIEDVFVHPEHRHRGVASTMISQIVDRARSAGCTEIVIAAEASDTPKRLYAALGFTPISTTQIWSPPAALA